MNMLSKNELLEILQQLKQDKELWMVVFYQILLLIVGLMKGIQTIGEKTYYFGIQYIWCLPFLVFGTILFYCITKYVLKGNYKIVLYSAILLTWGTFMDVLLMFPNNEKNVQFIGNQILLLIIVYAVAIAGGIAFLKIRRFRSDIFSFWLASISIMLYFLLILFGVGPGGVKNPEARTNLPFPVIGSIPITEVLKVIYLMVLICLLCKQSKTKKEKRNRLLLSAIYTVGNMFGMLIINEMGSLLILLLVYIAVIVVYMEEKRYSIMVLAMGTFVIAAGVFVGSSMIHGVNKKIPAQDVMMCLFAKKEANLNKNSNDPYGYEAISSIKPKEGERTSGTVENFRPYVEEYLDECVQNEKKRQVTKGQMEDFIKKLSKFIPTAGVEETLDDLFQAKSKIGYEDIKNSVSESQNKSLLIAMSYILLDDSDKIDFLDRYYFTKLYTYYIKEEHLNANILEKFYLPKYGKVNARFYCCIHPGWENEDAGYQNYVARQSVRAGGLLGKEEVGISTVPNVESDMVFVAVTEMFGSICAMVLLFVFFLLYWEGRRVALATKQEYNSGMIFGISFMIWIQAIFMTASNFGIFPIFGVPIPFISHGGASKCVMMGLIGIMVVMSAREVFYDPEEDEEEKNRAMIFFSYFVCAPLTEFIHRLSTLFFGRFEEDKEIEKEEEDDDKKE